jgi:hypothetical protein
MGGGPAGAYCTLWPQHAAQPSGWKHWSVPWSEIDAATVAGSRQGRTARAGMSRRGSSTPKLVRM